MASNMVYKLENNSLVPYQEFWGGQPRHEMLKKDQVSNVYMEGEGRGSVPAQDAKKGPG